jgi:hypothetical protein
LEYRALVYAKIAFDLTTHSPAHTAKFLDQICENAQDIRHVHIRFPKVLENGDGLFISDHSAQIIDKVQSACTGLTKVTFGPVCAFDGRVTLLRRKTGRRTDGLPGESIAITVDKATMVIPASSYQGF